MKGDGANRTNFKALRYARRRTLRHPHNMTSSENSGQPDKSRIREIPPDPPELPLSPDDLGAEMTQALLADPFPRQHDLEIFIDEDGFVRATVAHHAKHYVPDALRPSDSEQYKAGPGAAGHPGLYELALSVMVCYLPAGFDGGQPLILGTGRPSPEPIPVSRAAWELHRDFAEDILLHVDPAGTVTPPENIYEWVFEKRPDLENLLFADPTQDLFDDLF